jgi:uncharacterized surface protein with fasciclin (FAS1) repeats
MKFHLSLRIVLIITLLAVGFAAFAPTQAQAAPKSGKNTIVGIALSANQATGEFSTLIAALKYTGLVGALNGSGRFTVFAPTDAAFAKLGLNAQNITTLPKSRVTKILLYHVFKGELFAGNVVKRDSLRMASGRSASIEVNSNGAFIDGAKISKVNVDASNGVIHIIDSVMIP